MRLRKPGGRTWPYPAQRVVKKLRLPAQREIYGEDNGLECQCCKTVSTAGVGVSKNKKARGKTMKKSKDILDMEDKVAELRTKHEAAPSNADLLMELRMAESTLEALRKLAAPRLPDQSNYDAVKNICEIGDTRALRERAYVGGAE